MAGAMTDAAPYQNMAGALSYRVLSLVLGASFLTIYYAYQKKLLPRHISRLVGRALFYPTLPFTFIRRMNNFWTDMDGTVLMGVAPFALLGHPKALCSEGVRGVVNLCDEYRGPTEEYSNLGMKQLYIPTDDHYEPSFSDLQKAVVFIQQHAQRNEKVYVHCKSGHGRSAAVVLCWLLHHNAEKGMTPVEGNQLMLTKRSVRRKLFTQPNVLRYYNEVVKAKSNNKENAGSD